ncbi:MAG: PD-(D/E)XK nuclease family protein [Saprospiraceae bacterium]|nr:PD-(D/E)XK nuclease family protein [Lewinella sp.]
MTIYFGLALDESAYPLPTKTTGNVHHLGPNGLLHTLESQLGLIGHSNNIDYLRTAQYRQALSHFLADHPDSFFAASFAADQMATAAELLSRRDELLLAGWDFQSGPSVPDRLACLADIENKLQEGLPVRLTMGMADRWKAVFHHLTTRKHPVKKIRLVEPWSYLPPHLQTLFDLFRDQGVVIDQIDLPATSSHTDLGHFQQAISGTAQNKKTTAADGSLLILKGQNESSLAAWIAACFRLNKELRPLCLIGDKSRLLDDYLTLEGLPGLGLPAASLARPTLQVLKLVTVFLWDPIDPYKIMEFVSLAVKPLEDELAHRIAIHMAQTPGLQGEGWYIMLNRYFEELETQAVRDKSLQPASVRRQYRFWFERQRYDRAASVPKGEVIEIFAYLQRWAMQVYDDKGANNPSFIVLAEQAKRVVELLQTLPEEQLEHLELERIVRTIYEPAPVQFRQTEVGYLPFILRPAAMTGPTERLLWWNFSQQEPEHFFSRWYEHERQWLADRKVCPEHPQEENARLIWQRKLPILQTLDQLILIVPSFTQGKATEPHPLMGPLEAAFSDLKAVTFDLESGQGEEVFASIFELPVFRKMPVRQLGRPKPFLEVKAASIAGERETETLSSLEDLFYYPYQWVLKHKILLRKSPILSVVPDRTLMGNLAHRFFQRLLNQEREQWDQASVYQWIEGESRRLMRQEGAGLLLYGREPERLAFVNQVKYAAWSLINLIQKNGWKVKGTEQELQGKFLDIPVRGRADLVLEREGEQAVIDLKWRGSSRRERNIRNEEDLQLVLYSRLLTEANDWAHTAYFVMEDGKMISRNELAFQGITAVSPDLDHCEVNERIMEKMEATYQWRMEQIRAGRIEIRCEQTADALDEFYGAELLDLLEMRTGNAPFDDYGTLINLVE